MNKKRQRKYKGFGFAEALVALMISGVVGIVLLSISATAIAELRRIEVQDLLAQYAVNTAIQIQKGAMDSQTVNDFIEAHRPNSEKTCYPISEDGFLDIAKYKFGQLNEDSGWRIDIYENLDFRIPEFDEDGDPVEYFRYACLDPIAADEDPQTLVLEIVVGSVKFKGQYTTDSDIKDFRYIAVINI